MSLTSPPRERLLETATRLFYAEGVHAVGIDRIIAEAGVAKATFYHHFRSKDELVCAYLEEQSRLQRAVGARIPRGTPHEMVLAVFESVGELGRTPEHRGCPFINAAAEYPDPEHPVRRAIAEHRRWFRELLQNLLASGGRPVDGRTVDMLVALKDGLLVASALDEPARQSMIRDAVTTLLNSPDRPT